MTSLPEQIGRYAVASELGSGGMGEVYLAYSPAGDPVAVKLIRPDRLDPTTRQRFEKEALVARTVIGTSRVARFLDADPFADRPWMAMEYVPGQTLHAYIETDAPLPPVLVASLGALLAEGLSAVHTAGLLHRDLKPQNIILGSYGPVIIDFGLAAFIDKSIESLSRTGTIIGTPRCMSPEQAGGNPHVTPASDVYSLGTVLLYAATGHYPYAGDNWQVIVAQVANPDQDPDMHGLPDVLSELVTSMMAHQPAERPTLHGITESCRQLIEQTGVATTDARRALIDRTVGMGEKASVLTATVEDRLTQLRGDTVASPLNGRATREPDDRKQAGLTTPEQQPRSTEVLWRRARAASRIAAELRQAYSLQRSL